jgi:hypothetical protein
VSVFKLLRDRVTEGTATLQVVVLSAYPNIAWLVACILPVANGIYDAQEQTAMYYTMAHSWQTVLIINSSVQ